MRKLILFIVLLLSLCGCSNKSEDKFANYEHYNLDEINITSYIYVDDNRIEQIYAIAEMADIIPGNYEITVYGLFYQISTDDYILLDKIDSNQKKEYVTRFYNDKLYVIGAGSTVGNIEYTLNQEKITKKELKFDFYKGFLALSIEDIKDNFIYYYAITDSDIYVKLRCSLNTYKCDLSE